MNHFNYFTEIEETFVRRRGKNLLLSPLDWALMESWKERDIPLHIVLRAIEQVFDTHDAKPNAKRTIKSISYCKEEVEAQFAEWTEMQAGKGSIDDGTSKSEEPYAPDAVAAHIAASIEKTKSLLNGTDGVLREALERAIGRLEALVGSAEGPEQLEASLSKIDDLVDDAIIQQADESEVQEVDGQLASYKQSMDPDSYARTHRLMLLKRLREKGGVPRFSLFYL